MIATTTPSVDGYRVSQYLGIVAGEVALGTDFVRDFMAGLADFFGSRTAAYEEKLIEARELCISEMTSRAEQLGANAKRYDAGDRNRYGCKIGCQRVGQYARGTDWGMPGNKGMSKLCSIAYSKACPERCYLGLEN